MTERATGSSARQVTGDGADVFVCPTSRLQQGLWFLDRLRPGRATYNIPSAFSIDGHVDWPRFQQALDTLIARHESLRTTVASTGGRPQQVISPELCVPVDIVSVTGHSEPEAEGMRRLRAEAARPFDLSTGPLVRASAFAVGPSRHLVLFNVHHIISDGWSQAVFFQEFGQIYDALESGNDPGLPPVPIQYADYTLWQEQRLTESLVGAQLAYWKRVLAGAPDALPLPADRPRPSTPSGRGDVTDWTIGRAETAALRDLCRAESTTMFMVLAALVNVVLARMANQETVLIGVPVAGRVRAELEGAVGYFANTVVLRTDLEGDPSFRAILQRVRAAALGAYEHQDVPFAQVVDALKPERQQSHHPLFQVMCAVQRRPDTLLALRGLDVRPVQVGTGTAKFDLLFEFQEQSDQVTATLEYSADLFEAGTMATWPRRVAAALRAALANPDAALSSIPVVLAEEAAQLAAWNDTARAWPEGQTVVSRFEQTAARVPGAPALEFGDELLTYAELDRRANQLARFFRARGAVDRDRIGICLTRSADMVVAVVAALKAGAAYVPIDPAYPEDRRRFMAEDAGLRFVIVDTEEAARAQPAGVPAVALATAREAIAAEGSAALGRPIEPGWPCFVMYTSGSTGRPKGVVMPHGPMRNLIAWQLERSPTGLKTVQYGSLSFDASFHDIFATLVDGGHLYVVSESARKDPVELLDILRAHRIERIFLPFVALQLLAETAGGLAPDALREVCTAGEQLRVTSALREFFASIPACRLENYYGPTEAHVVTAHGLTGDSREWPELPPIGRPISNTLIHVLDRHLSPVPIGAVGELWIGGECLADGYWNRPDLTEERFRQVVIGGRSERLYRSGDLSKLLPDGAIQFLGRADDQVKIRGFRVEPAEIEATLESHPSVRQAAVTSRSTDRGARLVAYYVPAPGVELTVKALQDFLRGLMPDYMVPAAFVQLQEMPVTPSGKLDRRALPAEDVVARRRDRAPVAPGDEVEAALLAIWQDVLGIADIGTEDDFFDVGGHSLAAVQVVARVESACGVRVPVAALLDQTTIVRLAAYVGTLRAVLAVDGRPAGSTGGARDEFVF